MLLGKKLLFIDFAEVGPSILIPVIFIPDDTYKMVSSTILFWSRKPVYDHALSVDLIFMFHTSVSGYLFQKYYPEFLG